MQQPVDERHVRRSGARSRRARRELAGHLHGQLGIPQYGRAQLLRGGAARSVESHRQAERPARAPRRRLRIQPEQHFEQRSELLVLGRAARVLLQSGDAVAVLHRHASRERPSADSVRRLHLPGRQLDSGPPGSDRPPGRQKRPSAAEQRLQPYDQRLRVHAAARHDVQPQSRHGFAPVGRALRARAADLSGPIQRQRQQSRLRSLSGLLAVRLYDAAPRSAGAVLRQLRPFVRAALQGHRHVHQGDAVLSLRDEPDL